MEKKNTRSVNNKSEGELFGRQIEQNYLIHYQNYRLLEYINQNYFLTTNGAKATKIIDTTKITDYYKQLTKIIF